MASTIMHIAVCNEVYKLLSKTRYNYNELILGTIAPDINKFIGLNKVDSHFIFDNSNIPDIDYFIDMYKNSIKNNSFDLGYYIHLYTDKIFYKDYLPLFIKDDVLVSRVKCLDGNIMDMSMEDRKRLLYNDYTNLNVLLIDEYNLNLDIFFNEYICPDTDIIESNADKLNILIEYIGNIIVNSKGDKNYIIDISSIKAFINDCSKEIYDNLISLGII